MVPDNDPTSNYVTLLAQSLRRSLVPRQEVVVAALAETASSRR